MMELTKTTKVEVTPPINENMIPNLLMLPHEIILWIYSYLNHKEILNVSKVCSKLNVVAKDSSLWKNIEVVLGTKKQVLSFCKFFSANPSLLKLSLTFKTNVDSEEIPALNNCFSKLISLHCLYLKGLNLSGMKLPAFIKHLSCKCVDVSPEDVDSDSKFLECLSRLRDVEVLYLHSDMDVIFNNECFIASFLENSQHSLKSFTLVNNVIRQILWGPLGKCTNLRELGLGVAMDCWHNEEGIYDLITLLSKMPLLEDLDLNQLEQALFFRVLRDFGGFPKLRHLRLAMAPVEKYHYTLLKKLPSLEMFTLTLLHLRSTNYLIFLISFIKESPTLKNIAMPFHVLRYPQFRTLIEDIHRLQQDQLLHNACFCDNSNDCIPYGFPECSNADTQMEHEECRIAHLKPSDYCCYLPTKKYFDFMYDYNLSCPLKPIKLFC